jgi:transketolase
VVLVGNGAGYGYGVMGATHHALEDCASLLCLPHLRAYMPAFDDDVPVLVDRLFALDHPAYLRLGLSEQPADAAVLPYAPWRKLQDGPGWLMVVAGPLVGSIWSAVRNLHGPTRPTVWLLGELPISHVPAEFYVDLAQARRLLVVEEHVLQGGAAQNLATVLLAAGHAPERFSTRTALGYVSGRYGSQGFHRRECGLDPDSILSFLEQEDK